MGERTEADERREGDAQQGNGGGIPLPTTLLDDHAGIAEQGDDVVAIEQHTNGDAPIARLMTRDALLSRAKTGRPIKRVELPWLGDGMHVFVRPMSARQRDLFEDSITIKKGKKWVVSADNVRAKMIVLCACDADGKRLFKDGDSEIVGDLDARTADAIYAAIAVDSGVSDKDVDELAGNSASDPLDVS